MPEDPTLPTPATGEPPTEELAATGTTSIGVIGGHDWPGGLEPSPALEDPDEEWPVRGPKGGLRIPVPAAVLLVLLVGAGGIWGGAILQRGSGSTTSASSRLGASSLRSLFAGRTTTGGSDFTGTGRTGGFGAASAAATGTVTEVSGSTLYVTTSTGSLVKVVLGSKATVTREAATTLSGLKLGDTVVVQGTKAKSGTVTATSVTATAKGVTPAGEGFGGAASEGTDGAGRAGFGG